MGFEKIRYRPRKKKSDDTSRRDAALAKIRERIKTGTVFASVIPSECYHTSPRCMAFTYRADRLEPRQVKYANAKEASAAGHLRPCERCVNSVIVEIAGEPQGFTYDQVDTLAVIDQLSRERVLAGKSPGIR